MEEIIINGVASLDLIVAIQSVTNPDYYFAVATFGAINSAHGYARNLSKEQFDRIIVIHGPLDNLTHKYLNGKRIA